MLERYTPGLVETIAQRFYDDFTSPEWVDLKVDLEAALDWLQRQNPALCRFFRLWMDGATHEELATTFSLRERTVARLLDQTLDLLARYMNDEFPLDIPFTGFLDNVANNNVYSATQELNDE